jgi:hypothetical protein
MDTSTWIVIAVAVVLLAIVLGLLLARKKRETARLRNRFGDEYDRRVEQTGSEKQARKDLTGVQERREQLHVQPLAPAARDRYLQRWQVVQADFVDRPAHAVDQANDLVNDVMRERGYPVDDMGTKADMVAVDHPEVVQDFRAATDARRRHHASEGKDSTTEELRRAMVHYRSLFERLVGGPSESVDLRGQDETVEHRGRHSE